MGRHATNQEIFVKHDAHRSPRLGHRTVLVLALATALGSYALPRAQAPTKKVLTVEDYPKWRTLSGQEISGDGNWVVYGQAFTNTVPAEAKPVLHIVRLETNQHTEVPNGTGGIFSADSKWIAYQVDPTGGRGGRGRRGAGAGGPATAPSPAGDPAVPQGSPAAQPPANPAQSTTPPGQNPPTTPTQPPSTPPTPTTTAPPMQPPATPPSGAQPPVTTPPASPPV